MTDRPGANPDGHRRIGKYDILGEISRGGMGIVYKAREVSLDRLIALKVLIAGEDASSEQVMRFYHEAKACARLRHPNIVVIHDVGINLDRHYIAMDFIEGTTLEEKIATGPMKPDEAVRIVLPIIRAIAYAHQKGVVHRDVKPSNILIDRTGVPHITDFGLSKEIKSEVRLTRSGMAVGTPAYMAPEQAMGDVAATDARTDVYGLGATLYEAVTGRPPFGGENAMQTMMAVINDDPAPPSRLAPAVSRDLETIILKAMAKTKGHRYATADEMADDLQRFLSGDPIAARPASVLQRFARRIKRHRTAAMAIGSGVVALAIVLPALHLRRLAVRESLKKQGEADRLAQESMVEKEKEKSRWGAPVFRDTFDRVEPGKEWKVVAGPAAWIIQNGVLAVDAAKAQERPTFLKAETPLLRGNVQIRFDIAAPALPPAEGQFGCFLAAGADPRDNSYRFQFGAEGSRHRLYLSSRLVEQRESRAAPDTFHEVVLERVNERVTVTVDGEPVIAYTDLPLYAGGGLSFGFFAARGAFRVDNVVVATGGLPRKMDVVRLGDAAFSEQRYREALDRYTEMIQIYPGTASAFEALFKSALCREGLITGNPAERERPMAEAKQTYRDIRTCALDGPREAFRPMLAEARFRQAGLAMAGRNYEEAVGFYLQIRDEFPELYPARPIPGADAVGVKLLADGKPRLAAFFLERAIQDYPDAKEGDLDRLSGNLATALRIGDEADRAEEILKGLISEKPGRAPETRLKALFDLGATLLARDTGEALAAWRTAAAFPPPPAGGREEVIPLILLARALAGEAPLSTTTDLPTLRARRQMIPDPGARLYALDLPRQPEWERQGEYRPPRSEAPYSAGPVPLFGETRFPDAWRVALELMFPPERVASLLLELRDDRPEPAWSLTLSPAEGGTLRFYRGKELLGESAGLALVPGKSFHLDIRRMGYVFFIQINTRVPRWVVDVSNDAERAGQRLIAGQGLLPGRAVLYLPPPGNRFEQALKFVGGRFARRDFDGAAKVLAEVAGGSPPPAVAGAAAFWRGIIPDLGGRPAEALLLYDQCLAQAASPDAEALGSLSRAAAILAGEGRAAEALDRIRFCGEPRRARFDRPEEGSVVKEMEELLRTPEPAEARWLLSRLYARDLPDANPAKPFFLIQAGHEGMARGDFTEAASLFAAVPVLDGVDGRLAAESDLRAIIADIMARDRPGREARRETERRLAAVASAERVTTGAPPAARYILGEGTKPPAEVGSAFGAILSSLRAERTGNFHEARACLQTLIAGAAAPKWAASVARTSLRRLADVPTLRSWYAVGPFAAGAGKEIDADLSAEKDLELRKSYGGAERPVRWQLHNAAEPFVDAAAVFGEGNAPAVACAVAAVYAPEALEADLWAGCSAPWVVSVNGEKVITKHERGGGIRRGRQIRPGESPAWDQRDFHQDRAGSRPLAFRGASGGSDGDGSDLGDQPEGGVLEGQHPMSGR
ncbi:MAG: protein kinase [Planctomycetota bacterium]